MLSILTPDPSFFRSQEFDAVVTPRRKSLGLLQIGSGWSQWRRPGLSARRGVKTRAVDGWGRVRPRLQPRVVTRLKERQGVTASPAGGVSVASALRRQETLLAALDRQADQVMTTMVQSDQRLEELYAHAARQDPDMGPAGIAEMARSLLEQTRQDVVAWTLKAEDVERAVQSGWAARDRRRSGRGPSRLTSGRGGNVPSVNVAEALPASGGLVAAVAQPSTLPLSSFSASAREGRRPFSAMRAGTVSAPQGPWAGSLPTPMAMTGATPSLRVRMNGLALRPVFLAPVSARVEAMADALHQSEQKMATRRVTQQQAHERAAPRPKPPRFTSEMHKDTSQTGK